MITSTPDTLPARSLFHLAFHVTDLDAARRFYGGLLGCPEGRSSDEWIDFDLGGLVLEAGKDYLLEFANGKSWGCCIEPAPASGDRLVARK